LFSEVTVLSDEQFDRMEELDTHEDVRLPLLNLEELVPSSDNESLDEVEELSSLDDSDDLQLLS